MFAAGAVLFQVCIIRPTGWPALGFAWTNNVPLTVCVLPYEPIPPFTDNEPDIETEPVILVLFWLSTCIAFLLLIALVPVPTTNTASWELSWRLPVALYLPTNVEPPCDVEVFEADTIVLLSTVEFADANAVAFVPPTGAVLIATIGTVE